MTRLHFANCPLLTNYSYVLERRNLPARLGNMLKRPTLLLQPQELGETQTKKEKLKDGQDFSQRERGEAFAGNEKGARDLTV